LIDSMPKVVGEWPIVASAAIQAAGRGGVVLGSNSNGLGRVHISSLYCLVLGVADEVLGAGGAL